MIKTVVTSQPYKLEIELKLILAPLFLPQKNGGGLGGGVKDLHYVFLSTLPSLGGVRGGLKD